MFISTSYCLKHKHSWKAWVKIYNIQIYFIPSVTILIVYNNSNTLEVLDKINWFWSFCLKILDFPNFSVKTADDIFIAKDFWKCESNAYMISFSSIFDRRNIDLRSSTPDYKLDRGQESISNYFISTNIEHNTSRLASEEELRCWQNFNL